MNATQYAVRLKAEMDRIQKAMVNPGYSDHAQYREAVARYQALEWAHLQLNLSTQEEDDESI